MKQTDALAVRTEMRTKLETIEKKLKEIQVQSESPFKTNGEFSYNPSYQGMGGKIFIHRSTNLEQLLSVLAFLKLKKKSYDDAADSIELKTYPVFKWCGHTFESWEHDIKTRVIITTQHDKINKLKEAKRKLEQFMTEEDRLALVLKELEDLAS